MFITLWHQCCRYASSFPHKHIRASRRGGGWIKACCQTKIHRRSVLLLWLILSHNKETSSLQLGHYHTGNLNTPPRNKSCVRIADGTVLQLKPVVPHPWGDSLHKPTVLRRFYTCFTRKVLRQLHKIRHKKVCFSFGIAHIHLLYTTPRELFSSVTLTRYFVNEQK